MNVDLYPIRYNKTDLAQIPEYERLFHLMAGQLVNDISALNRITIFSLNGATGESPIAHANTSMALLMVKQLAGRVYEGGMLIQDTRFRSVLEGYRGDLPAAACDALDQLSTYFSGSNLLAKIRNRVSAHVDVKTFRSGYSAIEPDDEFIDYNSEYVANSLFYSSTLVGALSLKRITKMRDVRAAVDAVMMETIRVSGWFLELINEWMSIFVVRHLRAKLDAMIIQKEAVEDVRRLTEITIPVFTAGK